MGEGSKDAPYWPTEEAPPTMKAGFPTNFDLSPSSQGATKFAVRAAALWLKFGSMTVRTPTETDPAWSKETLSGI